MQEDKNLNRQVLFTVVLSFIVSVLGTILALGVLGPLFGFGENSDAPFVFNRPQILQKIIGTERAPSHDEIVVKVVQDASPAVVSIVASKDVAVVEQYYVDPFTDPFFQQFFGNNGSGVKIPQYRQKGTERKDVSSGSGFIVSADGLVVTNKHVVADTTADYTVFLNDGTKKPAQVLARDPIQDFAVLKIEGTNLPVLKLGDSSAIKIGQSAIVIGNALGEFRNTVSLGVVSGLHRSVMAVGASYGSESLEELIQTDAAINPGNSGGPLLNLNGEVVGINTAMANGAENIGFSIPINKVKKAIESVKKQGRIVYPFLGIHYTMITKDMAATSKVARDYGVLVGYSGQESAVVSGGPADKAGIEAGDIILMINGERIDTSHSLASLIQKYDVGDTVTLRVFRTDKEFSVKVVLEERK
ncbi:MAG: trypsin-like peptidase domain-containing protein [bacterium]|nr:trypsin-like peptidase domain-containing protein [bacterium]MDZ4286082.1 trypsin-like peptidase domain-containing protein [Candidatus Sungbacteria bacterium]